MCEISRNAAKWWSGPCILHTRKYIIFLLDKRLMLCVVWCGVVYTYCVPFVFSHFFQLICALASTVPHNTSTHSKSNPCNFCMDLVCQKDKMYIVHTHISDANFHSVVVHHQAKIRFFAGFTSGQRGANPLKRMSSPS